MKFILICSVILMFFFSASAEINNNDIPEKGRFDIKLTKIWEIDSAGDDLLASVRGIIVTDDGTVYIHDDKNLRFYIFSDNGKFKTAFGRRGEGPGEVRNMLQAKLYSAGNKIVARDIGRLHYFLADGTYIESVIISNKKRPFFFLDENEFIAAPLFVQDAINQKSEIIRINVKTKTEKSITRFVARDEVAINAGPASARVEHPALTPMVVVGRKDNLIFYGVNDHYKINMCDMAGKPSGFFTLTRKRLKVTYQEKFAPMWRAGKGRVPRETVEQLAKKMPSDINYFDKIEVNNGLIYVYNCYYGRKNIQAIDIFSIEGKYLYHAIVAISTGKKLITQPVLKDGYFYLGIMDEDGQESVGKFRPTLPQN